MRTPSVKGDDLRHPGILRAFLIGDRIPITPAAPGAPALS